MSPSRTLSKVKWSTYSPAPVVGVDEAGRGCLAGPVVAAAVVLSSSKISSFSDSKLLSESRREELYNLIISEHHWAVGFASVAEIESINILRASLLAMKRAVEGLKLDGGHVLVDGKFTIPDLELFQQTALIQGDRRAQPISAASIVAKVTRDRWMRTLHEAHPQYGFAEHKGYGTAAHLQALRTFGHTEHHRTTFRGVLQGPGERENSSALLT